MATRLDRRGFTLVELLLAALIGLIALLATTGFVIRSLRSQTGSEMRDDISRNSRYVSTSLSRDLANAGVALESTPTFGSVAVHGDTLSMLTVPYEPDEAPAYRLAGTQITPGEGTCGTLCIAIAADSAGVPFHLKAGDLARLQVSTIRRLILITRVTPVGTDTLQVQFTSADSILGRPAGLGGSLAIDPSGTFVQKLMPVVYWAEGNNLMRAERLDPSTGRLDGDVMADGLEALQLTLFFEDGHEAAFASGTDLDLTNDYNQIVSVRVRPQFRSARVSQHVNAGQPVTRHYDWRVTPRNLMYERNRT